MHTRSKFYVLAMTLIHVVVLTSGCGEEITAPVPSDSRPHLEYDDTPPAQTPLGNITFMDGSALEFIDTGISILMISDHGEAQSRFDHLMRNGRPDPVSVFEALSPGTAAPQTLKAAVQRLGIATSPVVLPVATDVDYFKDLGHDAPSDWIEWYDWYTRVLTDQQGDRTFDLTSNFVMADQAVHARDGKIRVRLYKKYYDVFSLSWKWKLIVDRNVYEDYTLHMNSSIAFLAEDTYRVKVTDASGNKYHIAMQ